MSGAPAMVSASMSVNAALVVLLATMFSAEPASAVPHGPALSELALENGLPVTCPESSRKARYDR